MTVYQEAYQLISQLPNESVKHLVVLLRSMTRARGAEPASMRLGAGKGVIVDAPDFDAWDGEAAALFEGALSRTTRCLWDTKNPAF